MCFKNSVGHFVEEWGKNKEYMKWALVNILELLVDKTLLSIRCMDELVRVPYKGKVQKVRFFQVFYVPN